MSNAKKPFKLVEIPVNNFKEIAIPHHLKLLADHKDIIKKVRIFLNLTFLISFVMITAS